MASYVDLSTLHTPTPRSKPPATWGAQIRENDEWFQQNRRQVCTSGTRPTGFEGLEIYETDTNIAYIHDGSGFVEIWRVAASATWTPTLTQSGAVTKTVSKASFQRMGRWIVGNCHLAVTGTGTAANIITVSLPANAAYPSVAMAVGAGYVFDSSAGTIYNGTAVLNSTSTVAIMLAGGTAGNNTMTAGLASPDTVSVSFTYEPST